MIQDIKVGLITIGQAPREDVISEMIAILGSEVEILERGALDGFSKKEIDKLKPEKNDFPLITRLKDKSSVVVGKKKLIPLIQNQIENLEKEGVEIFALLCTGDFPGIKSERIFLFPSKILFKTVTAILSKGKLGVLVPMEEQKQGSIKRWKKTGLDVIVDVLNPYRGASELEEVFDIIKRENVNLIVLDCIGYNMKIKEGIRKITGKLFLLPRTLLARFIRELIYL